ncbi:MAG: AraC family transcriptional regulator [Rhizobiaceae bacterium]|nr:AraC family transcriptional regulator [Rhizobiaceae bacterium]
MSLKSDSQYHARMQLVLRYIDEHLDDGLAIEDLAGTAAFSKYHFQRQFSALFKISVHRYIQLVRMKRASYRLAFRKQDSVLSVALDSGYAGPEAFARAFRQYMDQSPSAAKQNPVWAPWHQAYAPLNQIRSQYMSPTFTADAVEITDFPETSVAIKSHRGDPALVGDAIRQFIAWRRAEGLSPARSATYNIFHNDPDETPAEDYRLDICAGTNRQVPDNDAGVFAGTIPAGPCARVRLVGSADNLRPAISYLYGEWLPASSHQLRDYPIFAQRIHFFPDVPEHEAVTDVFLPLKKPV